MKLHTLTIKNFGCFDEQGVVICIDDIVTLIGQNDVGKSTILDAYEALASMGAPLAIDSFHKKDSANQVELEAAFIELTGDDLTTLGGEKWLTDIGEGTKGIRVRWVWSTPGIKGVKQAFSPETGDWKTGGLGGLDTRLQSRIPKPIRLRPDAKPEELESIICKILVDAVKQAAKRDGTTGADILEALRDLSAQFRDQVKIDLDRACTKVTERLNEVFPGYSVSFYPDAGNFDPAKLVGAGSHLLVESGDGMSTRLAGRGTGVQRSFLWSALAALSELGHKIDKRELEADDPKVLLIEEPESYLHPPAVRRARECLYGISDVASWQIICSTHSPIFIDLSKDHTAIVRVWRDSKQDRTIVRTYQTDKANFSEDEKTRLKMIRACDPSVTEFFFADEVWLCEGDTEQLVYDSLLRRHAADMNVHVVNCRGKGNLPMFMRILNQFGTVYIAIHDTDRPKNRKKDKSLMANSAWSTNSKIYEAYSERDRVHSESYLVCHVPDFELHYFGERVSSGKPDYSQSQILRADYDSSPELSSLRSAVPDMLSRTHELLYSDETEPQARVEKWVQGNPELISDEELWLF